MVRIGTYIVITIETNRAKTNGQTALIALTTEISPMVQERYRIDRAKELMTKNNILIKDVGEMVGFGTTQTFINVFKKQTGKTPKKWIDENIHTNALL